MADEQNKSMGRATRIYEALLRFFPREHRREYGPLMLQLFRDQYRDACRQGDRRALRALWLGTVVDVVRSAFLEQLTTQSKRMKNSPPEEIPAGSPQGGSANAAEAMPARDRKAVAAFFVFIVVPYVLLAAGYLLNVLRAEPMTAREQWLGAGASLIIPVICWSWRYFARFLPVLTVRRKRLVIAALSSVVGTFCTVGLVQLIPRGADGRGCLYPGTFAWAFLPMVIGITLLFGLEEAARRKFAGLDHA